MLCWGIQIWCNFGVKIIQLFIITLRDIILIVEWGKSYPVFLPLTVSICVLRLPRPKFFNLFNTFFTTFELRKIWKVLARFGSIWLKVQCIKCFALLWGHHMKKLQLLEALLSFEFSNNCCRNLFSTVLSSMKLQSRV